MTEANVDPTLFVDHVSIAVPRIADALSFFRRHFPIEIGCEIVPGYMDGFRWCEFYVGPFKIELIEPAEDGGFVARFLAKRGPGFHHWSLDGTHLAPLLERMEADGLRIVDRFEAPSGHKTAFISPRSAFGVLIQFWQVPDLTHPERPPGAVYRLRDGSAVRMRVDHISFAVRDIEATLRFFQRYFPFQLRRPAHPGWDGTFLVASFYINGYKVELIQGIPGKASFVERFIESRGEGFHHLSIDLDRLDAYVAQITADGVRVVDQRDLKGSVKTAFISPRSAHGVLIQLWQAPEFRGHG